MKYRSDSEVFFYDGTEVMFGVQHQVCPHFLFCFFKKNKKQKNILSMPCNSEIKDGVSCGLNTNLSEYDPFFNYSATQLLRLN